MREYNRGYSSLGVRIDKNWSIYYVACTMHNVIYIVCYI